jgi:cytochrome c553
LYDFQQGTRHGAMAAAMQPVVAKLSAGDILNLTAYAASLPVK